MTLYKKVIRLLPSTALREKIKVTKWKFSDMDLVCIIDRYANHEQKIKLLEECIANIRDKEALKIAKKLLKFTKAEYEEFIKPYDNVIFSALVEGDTEIFAKDYSTALKLLTKYYNSYFKKDKEKRSYGIYKYYVYDGKVDSRFTESIGHAKFNDKLEPIYYSVNSMYYAPWDNVVSGPTTVKNCVFRIVTGEYKIKIPPFIKRYDLVKWRVCRIGEKSCEGFGILYNDEKGVSEERCFSTIIAFDDVDSVKEHRITEKKDYNGDMLYYYPFDHDFYDDWRFEELDKMEENELTEENCKLYHYVVDEMKRRESEKSDN